MAACSDVGCSGLLSAVVQGYMDLVIITAGPKGNLRAPCTFSLLAKDGVYLMQIPRPVDNLVLAAGNRHVLSVWLFDGALVMNGRALLRCSQERKRALFPVAAVERHWIKVNLV